MNIIIRKSTQADIPGIYKMILEFAAFQKTPEKVFVTEEQMREETSLFQCLVAETDRAELVGFASFFYAYYSWSGKAIYLDDLYIREQYRRNKAGKMLLDELISEGRRNGCRKLRWQVSRWNEKAIGFYKSLGAHIDETEINCDLNL